ncbi:MAG TPA: hypothetical protein EYP58_02480 [bacterium (Candidatus Stahlbacteria)]|nr:hypothetical protein [Candidatus Stahlbacteria bacterium]
MRIKSLTLYGFKSFPEELRINFHPGITVIVGPNGSGKTNIFDALRWIFGDQSPSSLRCEKMGGLIFLGSEKRKPSGFTEVKLTLENAGEFHEYGSEVEIMRRFYRSQESDFFINRSLCRLKDIQDLGLRIGGLSYAFLENSKIKEIINGNIKKMFDESAGIARYYDRREEALRRIGRGEDELKRLDDLINEMSRTVRSLKRQANKVERLKKLEDLKKKAELKGAIDRLDTLKGITDRVKKDLRILEQQEVEKGNEIKGLREEADKLEELITSYEDKLARKKALDWERGRLTAETETRKKEIIRIESDLAQLDESVTTGNQKISAINKTLSDKEQEISSLTEQLTKAEKELTALIEHRQDFTTTQSDVLAELRSNEALTSRLRNEINRLEGEVLKLREDLHKTIPEYEALEAEITEHKRNVEQLRERYQNRLETIETITAQKKIAVNEMIEIRAEIQSLKNMDRGQKADFYKQRFKENFVGMVYDLVKPKPGYEKAVDAVLGEISGYALLIELDPGLLKDLEEEGVGIIVADAKSVKKKVKTKFVDYPEALAYFFKDVIFADEIPDQIGGKVVTKSGILLTANMIRTSNLGYLETNVRLKELSKKELDNKVRIESLEHEIKRIEKEIENISDEQKKIELALEEKKNRSFDKSRVIEIKRSEIKSKEDRIHTLQREISELDSKLTATSTLVDKSSDDLKGISREISERKAKIAKLKLEENQLRSEIERLRLERSQAQIELESLKMKISTSSNQLKEDKHRLDEIEIKLIEIEAEQEKIGPIPEEAWGKRKEIIQKIDQIETGRKDIKEKTYQLRLENYRYEEERKNLIDLCDRCDLKIDDDEVIPAIETIEAKISSIGIVNPLSISQYLEEKKRLDDFVQQRSDVAAAIAKLKSSIRESDKNATERLVDKLQAVNLEFGLVFETVFGGGQGRIRFQDPDNPLQSPIEIISGLPGKKIKRLAQLSSGERALLAVTLLFAFYRVNPAPFLILDEVDAPLDDANVRKLAGFLKDLSRDIQIIIITHNPMTIKIADYLYGVTMEERGVSKMVAVDFRDVARIME